MNQLPLGVTVIIFMNNSLGIKKKKHKSFIVFNKYLVITTRCSTRVVKNAARW